jgi:hypothetical protein
MFSPLLSTKAPHALSHLSPALPDMFSPLLSTKAPHALSHLSLALPDMFSHCSQTNAISSKQFSTTYFTLQPFSEFGRNLRRDRLHSEFTSSVTYVSVTEYSELFDKATVAQLLNKPPHFYENQ